METKYFKTKRPDAEEETVMRARFDYTEYAENPRNPNFRDTLGTIVMKPWNSRTAAGLGDVQTNDWREYFVDSLGIEGNTYTEVSVKVKIPSVEEARKSEKLLRYVAGNDEFGYRFDKELLVQDVEADISGIRERNDSLLDDIDAGIEIDENNQTLKDELFVSFRTSGEKNYSSGDEQYDEDRTAQEIENEVTSFFDELGLEWNEKSTSHNTLDDMTDYELFNKWNEKNLVCLPISAYEHSGITLGVGEDGKVSHEKVHEKYQFGGSYDNDEIKEDGFIFVEKDNQEVLNELKGEARDSDGNVYNKWQPKTLEETKEWAKGILKDEFDEYNNYVEGSVYDVTLDRLNPDTLEWENIEQVSNLCEDNLDSWLSGWVSSDGILLSKFITEEEANRIAHTITPKFKDAQWNRFLDEVRKELPNFDGKAEYASAAVLYAMGKNGSSNLEKEALRQVMAEKGFDSKEKTVELLNRELGLSEKNMELKPLMSLKDERLTAYWSQIRNPNRSDNLSMGKLLLVDEKNRQFILYNDVSYVMNKSDVYTKDMTKLSSARALESKAVALRRYGFSFGKSENEYYRKHEADQKYFDKYLEKDRER